VKEEQRPGVSEDRALRRMFGPKKKQQEAGENCVMKNSILCTLHKVLLGL
jgi:hypothetical protein